MATIAHLRTSKYFQIVLKQVKDFFNWSREANSAVHGWTNSVQNLQKMTLYNPNVDLVEDNVLKFS